MRPTTVLPVCDMMPVRSDHSSQMAATCAAAKQEPRCLQPIQPVQAVDCIAVSSTVFGCPAPVAMARPICHCWCDSSAVCHLRLCPLVGSSDCTKGEHPLAYTQHTTALLRDVPWSALGPTTHATSDGAGSLLTLLTRGPELGPVMQTRS